MLPTLFNVFLKEITKISMNVRRKIAIGGKSVEGLRFVDDMVYYQKARENW